LLTSENDGLDWTDHSVGNDADLVCQTHQGAYGKRGVLARPEDGVWKIVEYDPDIDYVACSSNLLVSADRRVHETADGLIFTLDWQPHAVDNWYLVGEGGRAGYYDPGGPHEF
jgi:hypothetical protein